MSENVADLDRLALNKKFTLVAWVAFLVMWGVTLLVERFTQADLRNLQYDCVGLILLGLNGARFVRSIPMSRLTLVVGLLALLGGIVRQFSGELNVISAVLITAGALLLAYGIMTRQGAWNGSVSSSRPGTRQRNRPARIVKDAPDKPRNKVGRNR